MWYCCFPSSLWTTINDELFSHQRIRLIVSRSCLPSSNNFFTNFPSKEYRWIHSLFQSRTKRWPLPSAVTPMARRGYLSFGIYSLACHWHLSEWISTAIILPSNVAITNNSRFLWRTSVMSHILSCSESLSDNWWREVVFLPLTRLGEDVWQSIHFTPFLCLWSLNWSLYKSMLDEVTYILVGSRDATE